MIEALRVGVAPAQHIKELTIGLEQERASLSEALNRTHGEGGAVRAVIGEYGFGKSHIVELTAREALDRDFLVAATSLDLAELPPHRAFDIYGSLMRNLRYPNNDERGLGPLLAETASIPRLREQLRTLAPEENDPLTVGLDAFSTISSSRQRAAWENWLMGGRRVTLMNRATPRKIRFPTIDRVGHNARQIAYLLSGVSVLARLAGYSGLCVLIDEAESYSLLQAYQRPKATLFFSAVIRTALGEERTHTDAAELPQHRFRDYPVSYGERQSLFFLFTVTRSENRLPLEDWLDDEQILALDPHHSPQEIGQFLEQVMDYHAQAYGYEPDERQRQIRRGAAEQLAAGMRNDRLSIRGVVRLGADLHFHTTPFAVPLDVSQAVARHLGLAPGQVAAVPVAEGTWLFHFWGDLYGEILAQMLGPRFAVHEDAAPVTPVNEHCLYLPGPLAQLPGWDLATLQRAIHRLLPRIEPMLELGRFHGLLHPDVARRAVIEECDPPRFERLYRQARVIQPASGLRARLEGLL